MMFFKFSRNNQVVTETLPAVEQELGLAPEDQLEAESVNRVDLVRMVAKEAGTSRVEAEKALNSFLDAISASLAAGKRVRISGFGQFSVRRSKRHKFRNPRTGGPVSTIARPSVRFKPSATLKQAMSS